MNYCVYAFVDSTQSHEVFHIGYGTGNRWPDGTLDLCLDLTSTNRPLGYDIGALFEAEMLDESNGELHCRINRLRSSGLDANDIVRVVARHLDHAMAMTVHEFLTIFAYDKGQLTSPPKASIGRFRHAGDWAGFHFGEGPRIDQYTYVLRDPSQAEVFYVGRGTRNRVWDHFRGARRADPALETEERLLRTRALLAHHPKEAIARTIAHSLSTGEAVALESLAVKFIYGFRLLANQVRGGQSGRFRAMGDWSPRRGFELPLVINDHNGSLARADQLETAIMNGYDQDLLSVRESSPEVAWEGPVLLDSNDLSLRTKVIDSEGQAAAELKVAMRTNGFLVEVRGRPKQEKTWVIRHANERFGNYRLRRADGVFLPDPWHRNGRLGLAKTLDVALARVRLMREWAKAPSRAGLEQAVGTEATGELLEVDPRLRGGQLGGH